MDFLAYSKNILGPTKMFSLKKDEKDYIELSCFSLIFEIIFEKLFFLEDMVLYNRVETLNPFEEFIFQTTFLEKSEDERRKHLETAFSLTNSSKKISDVKNLLGIYNLSFEIREDFKNNLLWLSNIFLDGSSKNLNETMDLLKKTLPIDFDLAYDNGRYSFLDLDESGLSFLEIEKMNLSWRDFKREG